MAWYSSRLNAQVVAAPAAQEALGIGQVVSALGRTAGAIAEQDQAARDKASEVDFAIAEREKARARDDAAAKASVALAQNDGEYSRWVIDNQNDAQFESKANAKVDADMNAVRGLLGDDEKLTELYAPVLARTAETRKTQAFSHVAALRAKASGEALDAGQTAWGNVVDSHPERTEEAAAAMTAAITANSSIPDALKPQLIRSVTGGLWLKGLGAQVVGGRFDAVSAELEAGTYDGVLPKGGKDGLQRMIGAQRTLAAQAAASAASDEKRAANDALAVLRSQIDHGDSVPVGTIHAAIARGKAAGVDDKVLVDAAYLGQDMVYDSKIMGLDTPGLTATVDSLRAKRDAGKLKGNEARFLDRGEKELKDRTEKQADTLAPLLKPGASIEQRVQGVEQLAAMPLDQRMAAAHAAGDDAAGMYAVLNPRGRVQAVQGAAARKDRPLDFLPPVPNAPGGGTDQAPRKRLAQQVFDSELGALKDDMAGGYDPLFNAALDLMAGNATNWRPGGLTTAVQVLSGRTWRADHTAQGGIGTVAGKKVELPPQWSEHEVEVSYARSALSGAVYDNGDAANPADVRRTYRLKYFQDGANGSTEYRFVSPSGRYLQGANGGDYVWVLADKPMGRR